MTRRGILGMMAACLVPWRKLFPVRIRTTQGLEALERQSAIAWLHGNGVYFHDMLEYQRHVLWALDEGRLLTVTLPRGYGKSFVTPRGDRVRQIVERSRHA